MHREGVVMTSPQPTSELPFGNALAGLLNISTTNGNAYGGGNAFAGGSDKSLEARRRAAAIGMLAAQHADFGARNAPALVIVPAMALSGWAAEFARWGCTS
jgi:hypothetical protein